MRHAVGVALIFALAPAWARAFTKPIHASITRKVLSARGFDKGAVGDVVSGNLAADDDEKTEPAAHFDDEKFSAGAARLKAKMAAVLDALARCDAREARAQFGRSLHSVQDFCSHSNWVETRGSEAIDFLALVDPPAELVCDRKSHKGGLTTGYYPDNARPAPHKCVHAELNKDSPKRPGHGKALKKAVAETSAYLKLVEKAALERFGEDASVRLDFFRGSTASDLCPARP